MLGSYDAVDLRIGVDSTTWIDEQSLQLTLPAQFESRFTAGEKAMIYGSVTGLVGGLGGLFVGAALERFDGKNSRR